MTLVFACGLLLSACGQKGALYLPNDAAPKPPAVKPSAPAPAATPGTSPATKPAP